MPPAEPNGAAAKSAPSADLDNGHAHAANGDSLPSQENRGLHTRTLSFSELQR